MQLYIGVDFHPHRQTVAWCDLETGEIKTQELLHHSKQFDEFYQALPPAVIGIEASVNAVWFENLLANTSHQLLVGNPSLIRARARSRHKSDRRDAELILDLLMKDEFPALWRRGGESNQVLDILKLRLNLVRQRTQIFNRLQALAHSFGLPPGRIKRAAFQERLKQSEVNPAQELQRSQLFKTIANLDGQIGELESWLHRQAETDRSVALLQTQMGVGYLTALAAVHTLGDVWRFTKLSKQVVAFVGLDRLEKSSAGKQRFGAISKKGSSLLRGLLGQAGNMAARSEAKLKTFQLRLTKKKAKAVAKTAVSRKLLIKLAIMLRDGITAQEFEKRGSAVGNARTIQGQR